LAELENQKKFSSLLSSGVKALKQHPDYKTNREAGNKTGQSYMEKIAYKLVYPLTPLKAGSAKWDRSIFRAGSRMPNCSASSGSFLKKDA